MQVTVSQPVNPARVPTRHARRWLPQLVRTALGEERLAGLRALALNLFAVVMCEHTARYRDALVRRFRGSSRPGQQSSMS